MVKENNNMKYISTDSHFINGIIHKHWKVYKIYSSVSIDRTFYPYKGQFFNINYNIDDSFIHVICTCTLESIERNRAK